MAYQKHFLNLQSGRNLDDKVNHIQETFEDGVASLSILHTYCDDEGKSVNECNFMRFLFLI